MAEEDLKNHVKNHTREAVLDRMQSSGNATGFATGCSVTHQLPWEQRAITGAFERFFSLLPPAGQSILNSPGIGTAGELNLCPWPKASGCTGALGHSQSSTVGHRSSSWLSVNASPMSWFTVIVWVMARLFLWWWCWQMPMQMLGTWWKQTEKLKRSLVKCSTIISVVMPTKKNLTNNDFGGEKQSHCISEDLFFQKGHWLKIGRDSWKLFLKIITVNDFPAGWTLN